MARKYPSGINLTFPINMKVDKAPDTNFAVEYLSDLTDGTILYSYRLMRVRIDNPGNANDGETYEYQGGGLSDINNWSRVYDGLDPSGTSHDALGDVNLAGDGITYGHIDNAVQSIYGAKTFIESPIVPTPTIAGQSSNKDYVDSSIDAVEIGGVNLLSYEKSYLVGDSFILDSLSQLQPTITNKIVIQETCTYTLSFYSKQSINCAGIRLVCNEISKAYPRMFVEDSEFVKYENQYLFTKGDVVYIQLYNHDWLGNYGNIECKFLQLEKGNKATAWSPSIEDVKNDYTTLINESVNPDAFDKVRDDTDNITEGGTNKFTNADDVFRLSATSGTNTGDQDLSPYITTTSATNSFEPLKGSDDNFVTDAEKTLLGNTSGANTGDQDLSGKVDVVIGKGLSTLDYGYTDLAVVERLAPSLQWMSLFGSSHNIDCSVNRNARCLLELSGNLAITLTELSTPCEGIISIQAQTAQKTISIAALSNDGVTVIDVYYLNSEVIETEDALVTEIGWSFNGYWVSVNKGGYGTI